MSSLDDVFMQISKFCIQFVYFRPQPYYLWTISRLKLFVLLSSDAISEARKTRAYISSFLPILSQLHFRILTTLSWPKSLFIAIPSLTLIYWTPTALINHALIFYYKPYIYTSVTVIFTMQRGKCRLTEPITVFMKETVPMQVGNCTDSFITLQHITI